MAATTESHLVPNFPPPPSFLDYSHRRLPQPIQLPPLTIPPTNVRPEHQYGQPPPQTLPSIHSGPPPRSQPLQRPPVGPAAPLDKLLSPHPYTPPRSDPTYSPQYESRRSPPRSAVESRLPPRRFTERLDEPRTVHPERLADQPFLSPIDHQRHHSFGALPSPSYTVNTPNYTSSNQPFRTSVGSQQSFVASPYGPSTYAEPTGAAPRQNPAAVPHGPPPGPIQDRHLDYKLVVRQQPIAARACGFGERDRRVIDPPPIIQLEVRDPKTGTVDLDEVRYSLNVVHCTLWNADGSHEETALVQPDRRTTRRLMGQLVASPSVAKDEHDNEGCFFCFPDLSCRTHGKYRLRFVLMRIDPTNLHVGGFSPILTDVQTEVFTVYTAKDFPGMRPSSALTRALKLQGCNIQVKKGNEKALVRKRPSPSDEDEDDGDGDRESGRAPRRRRKE